MNHRSHPRRRGARRRRGAAIVEAAVIMPLALLLIVGAVDLTWVYMLRHTADVAAYEAAKSGFVPGSTAESVAAEARSRMELFRARDVRVEVSAEEFGAAARTITVRVTLPVAANTWSLAARRETLLAEHTARRGPS